MMLKVTEAQIAGFARDRDAQFLTETASWLEGAYPGPLSRACADHRCDAQAVAERLVRAARARRLQTRSSILNFCAVAMQTRLDFDACAAVDAAFREADLVDDALLARVMQAVPPRAWSSLTARD